MQFQFSDDNLQMQRTLARVELAKARENLGATAPYYNVH